MDVELKAIQQVRSVLGRHSLNQSQRLRVLHYVIEGIYREQQHEKQAEVGNQVRMALDGPSQSGQQGNSDPLAHARIEPPVSTYRSS